MIRRSGSAGSLGRYTLQITIAAGAVLLALLLTDVGLLQKAVALSVGLLVGVWGGLTTARSLEHRVDRGRGLVLYFEETAPYGVLLPLAFASLLPFGLGVAIDAVTRSVVLQRLLQLALCGSAAAWLAHDVILFTSLRRLAARLGPLEFQWFYTRSSTGPEGMIGKTGVVTTECAPEGYVRMGAELWKARSLDGACLTAGQSVIVRRLDGLVLLIDVDQASRTLLSR
jgi:membrane protein implicated in regulation of membrane protease activity